MKKRGLILGLTTLMLLCSCGSSYKNTSSSEENGVKNLQTGDIVLVEVKNTDLTLSQQLKNWMYKIVGNDTATVIASKAGMVQ